MKNPWVGVDRQPKSPKAELKCLEISMVLQQRIPGLESRTIARMGAEVRQGRSTGFSSGALENLQLDPCIYHAQSHPQVVGQRETTLNPTQPTSRLGVNVKLAGCFHNGFNTTKGELSPRQEHVLAWALSATPRLAKHLMWLGGKHHILLWGTVRRNPNDKITRAYRRNRCLASAGSGCPASWVQIEMNPKRGYRKRRLPSNCVGYFVPS